VYAVALEEAAIELFFFFFFFFFFFTPPPRPRLSFVLISVLFGSQKEFAVALEEAATELADSTELSDAPGA